MYWFPDLWRDPISKNQEKKEKKENPVSDEAVPTSVPIEHWCHGDNRAVRDSRKNAPSVMSYLSAQQYCGTRPRTHEVSTCGAGSQQEGLHSSHNCSTGEQALRLPHTILNKQVQDPKGSCRQHGTPLDLWGHTQKRTDQRSPNQ